jgi:signal transduction histidine kinase
LAVHLDVAGTRNGVPAGVDLAAYRIVQEALTNVIKHAKATEARIELSYEAGRIRVVITDDGTSGNARAPGGHGLIGMAERVALYDGQFEAGPLHENGFRVRAVLPYGRSAS